MNQATIYLSGSVNMPIIVNLTDTISTLLDQINLQNISNSQNDFNVSNSKVLFNNIILSPALSLMFYGIHDGSELTIIRKNLDHIHQLHLNDRMTCSTNNLIDNIIQPQCMNGIRKINSRTRRPLLSKVSGTGLLQDPEISRSLDYFPQSYGISPSKSSNVDLTLGEIGKSFNSDDGQENQDQICFNDPSYHAISNSEGSFRYKINDECSNSILTPNVQLNRNSQINRSTNGFVSKRMQKFFMEKCSNNMRDPEFVLQRYQDSINPKTAIESARITDIYRSRIESNSLSFRKLCKKYNNLPSNDRIRKNPSMPTILPAKADEPSTDFLPELCPSGGSPIHTYQ